MKCFSFDLLAWSAWAPGLETREAWSEWALTPYSPTGAERPSIANVPAALRRRCSQHDRMVLEVGTNCAAEAIPGSGGQVPPAVVLGSRHGEAQVTRVLLDLLAEGEPLSPMRFSLSVHNASSGLLSIATGNKGVFRSISASIDSLGAAWIEALSLLVDHSSVLLIVAEEEPPADHHPYLDEQTAAFALAVLLGRGEGCQLELAPETAPLRSLLEVQSKSAEQPSLESRPLPHALQLAAWLARGEIGEFEMSSLNLNWRLAKNGR